MEIMLSDANIQSIINGRDVVKMLPDGTAINIRLSYVKDVAAPIINDRFQVKDMVVEERLQQFKNNLRDTYRLGG